MCVSGRIGNSATSFDMNMMMMLQLALLIDSCKLAIKSLKKWMTPEQVFFPCN
jgi:hypothetical protein